MTAVLLDGGDTFSTNRFGFVTFPASTPHNHSITWRWRYSLYKTRTTRRIAQCHFEIQQKTTSPKIDDHHWLYSTNIGRNNCFPRYRGTTKGTSELQINNWWADIQIHRADLERINNTWLVFPDLQGFVVVTCSAPTLRGNNIPWRWEYRLNTPGAENDFCHDVKQTVNSQLGYCRVDSQSGSVNKFMQKNAQK